MPTRSAIAPEGFYLLHQAKTGSPITSLAWSPTGEWLLAAAGVATSWQWRQGTLQRAYGVDHTVPINSVTWSPDGKGFAFGAFNRFIGLCALTSGKRVANALAQSPILSLAWSPLGNLIAAGTLSGAIELFDSTQEELVQRTLRGHGSPVRSLAWAPDGRALASGTEHGTLGIWRDQQRSELRTSLMGHTRPISSVDWSPDGSRVASGSHDGTVRVWDPTEHTSTVLRGHETGVACIRFSPDGRFLVSKGFDGSLVFWSARDLRELTRIEQNSFRETESLSFHPRQSIFATSAADPSEVLIWKFDPDCIEYGSQPCRTAKIAVVGPLELAASALVTALAERSEVLDPLPMGDRVCLLHAGSAVLETHKTEIRRVVLWNPGFRPESVLLDPMAMDGACAVLMLHEGLPGLDAVVALRAWSKLIDSHFGPTALKIAVLPISSAARALSAPVKLDELPPELGIARCVALNLTDEAELARFRAGLLEAISWERIPQVRSTLLLKTMHSFLENRRDQGWVLAPEPEIMRAFVHSHPFFGDEQAVAFDFARGIDALQHSGVVIRLRFGSYLLSKPHLLETYARAIATAASEAPDGTGALQEERIYRGAFSWPPDSERIRDSAVESMLLRATVEELLAREIAIRASTNEATYIVFPSRCTRQKGHSGTADAWTLFELEGLVDHIYSELTVRLAHSGFCELLDMWANVAEFQSNGKYRCQLFVNPASGIKREIFVGFDALTPQQVRDLFLGFVRRQVERGGCEVRSMRQLSADDGPLNSLRLPSGERPKRTQVFISYSHRDESMRERIDVHLRPLERAGKIESWSDVRIRPGSKWREEIRRALQATKVAVLLISADFLASDFIAENELPPLLEAAQSEGLLVLCVILKPCRFARTDLSFFQAMNDPATPLSSMNESDREEVWRRIADEIERHVGS